MVAAFGSAKFLFIEADQPVFEFAKCVPNGPVQSPRSCAFLAPCGLPDRDLSKWVVWPEHFFDEGEGGPVVCVVGACGLFTRGVPVMWPGVTCSWPVGNWITCLVGLVCRCVFSAFNELSEWMVVIADLVFLLLVVEARWGMVRLVVKGGVMVLRSQVCSLCGALPMVELSWVLVFLTESCLSRYVVAMGAPSWVARLRAPRG